MHACRFTHYMAAEAVLNTYLASLLRAGGVDAAPEVRQPDASQTDIECRVDDTKIAIEAKIGRGRKAKEVAGRRRLALRAADDKLIRRDVCTMSLALLYPDTFETEDDVRSGEVEVSVRMKQHRPPPGKAEWRRLRTMDLAALILQLPNELGSPEVLAGMARTAVLKAAGKFTKPQAALIMANMGPSAKGTNVRGLMTDLLTAIMFHAQLDGIRHDTPRPVGITAGWPPSTVRACQQSITITRLLYEAHRSWLAVDYRQILEWSCAILNALPESPAKEEAAATLIRAALDIQSAKGKDHHDLIGITFCQSVETARSDGSMYTSLPAAVMLAGLLFNGLGIDWTDYDQVIGLRVVDFACGTGTLLIAVVNHILQHEGTGRRDEVCQALLEQVTYGFDINNRAIFQTATGLGMVFPPVTFNRMHLYSMVLGADHIGHARLGSLELLADKGQLSLNPRPTTGTRIDASPAPIECSEFDLAIMNPPYTRVDIRHDQLGSGLKKRLGQREAELYAGLPITRSSNANGFMVLAERFLNSATGRLGIVGPSSFCTAPSARGTRMYLAGRFHVRRIVVSHDPTRLFMSGETSIGEMLMVLDRNGLQERRSTEVVKLIDNPASAADASTCMSSINNGTAADYGRAVIDLAEPAAILDGDWSAVQFMSNELYRITTNTPWTSTLGHQVRVEVAGRPIRNTIKCGQNERFATAALYDHNANYCDRMELVPDCHVRPPRTKEKGSNEVDPDAVEKINASLRKANYLHLTNKMNFPTIRVFACRTTVPAVGSSWRTCSVIAVNGVDTVALEKALVLILNSTPGKLAYMLVRVFRKLSYAPISIADQHRVVIPNLRCLGSAAVESLAEAYDHLAPLRKRSLPEAHLCEVQAEIDRAVCKHTGYDLSICIDARHLLSSEPSVTGKQYSVGP